MATKEELRQAITEETAEIVSMVRTMVEEAVNAALAPLSQKISELESAIANAPGPDFAEEIAAVRAISDAIAPQVVEAVEVPSELTGPSEPPTDPAESEPTV